MTDIPIQRFILTQKVASVPRWAIKTEWSFIRATIEVVYTTADDYVCNVIGDNVEVEGAEAGKWEQVPLKTVLEELKCSAYKLGELFEVVVVQDVWQHMLENPIG